MDKIVEEASDYIEQMTDELKFYVKVHLRRLNRDHWKTTANQHWVWQPKKEELLDWLFSMIFRLNLTWEFESKTYEECRMIIYTEYHTEIRNDLREDV